MKTMQARFPGKCARTGASISTGDIIQYSPKTRRTVLVHRFNPEGQAPADYPVDADLELARTVDNELASSDPDAATHAGRYLRQSIARGVSDVWRSGGREFYRNRRGLCEDAPCCGCCNA